MGFRLQQKLMTLNVNSLLCRQCDACCDQRLRLESCGFRCKVALYLSYLHNKFYDKIRRESLRISSIISDYPTSEVKLTSMLHCNKSQSLLSYMSVIASVVLYTQTPKTQTTFCETPLRSLCDRIHIELSSKHVLAVALTMH